MARPREFEEDAVLSVAAECFWAYGYEATSVRDLASRMGITGASLYNAFGDKRSLYRRALAYYVENSFGGRVRRLERHMAPRDVIEAFFAEIIDQSLNDKQRKGCMLVNSALEVAPHDPEFQHVVAGVMKEIEAFFRRNVEAAQRAGTIGSSQSAEDFARLLLSLLLGIQVLVRTRPERALLEGIMRPVFAMFDDETI
jgi:TetR/AcrR family transcriptional regulator, transcriptional repressor for nem operon